MVIRDGALGVNRFVRSPPLSLVEDVRYQVEWSRRGRQPMASINAAGLEEAMGVKNIQVIDGDMNAAYAIFAVTDEEFS
jgi:hypothetical protein